MRLASDSCIFNSLCVPNHALLKLGKLLYKYCWGFSHYGQLEKNASSVIASHMQHFFPFDVAQSEWIKRIGWCSGRRDIELKMPDRLYLYTIVYQLFPIMYACKHKNIYKMHFQFVFHVCFTTPSMIDFNNL